MTSDKQIEANRKNALKSTGPRSPEGKAIVSRNAIKHSRISKNVVLEDENADHFKALRNRLYNDLRPVGVAEELALDRYIINFWRWLRAVRIETNLIEDVRIGFGSNVSLANKFKDAYRYHNEFLKHQRYEDALTKKMTKAFDEFQRLQKVRKKRDKFLHTIDIQDVN